MNDGRAEVHVADRHQATGTSDPAQLAQGCDRVVEVLEHLVRVHDVERVVGQVERVHVRDPELDLGMRPTRLGDDVRRGVDAQNPSR
jgi:hypothetical protein